MAYRLTDRGLVIAGPLSDGDWREIGMKLTRHLTGLQWAIGDWILALPRRMTLTDTLELAADVLPYDVPALRSHAVTAQAFKHKDRTVPLAWSFYRESMPLPVEKRIPALREAATTEMKLSAFKTWVVNRLDRLPTVEDVAPVEKGGTRHADHRSRGLVSCPHCEQSFYVKVKSYEDGRTLVSMDREASARENAAWH